MIAVMQLLGQSGKSLLLPPPSSTYAAEHDWLFYLVIWVSAFFVALIFGLLIVFIIRFRQRCPDDLPGGAKQNMALELTWTVIPLIIVIIFFVFGFQMFIDVSTPPANTYQVIVTAYKWGWEFTYPNGATSDKLHVPAGRPVLLVLESRDVIHSFYVPDFRIKRDVVPGRYNKLWFEVPEPGVHDIYCAEYCGTQHSQMLSKVVVHTPTQFLAWLEDASNWIEKVSPSEAGRQLVESKGCMQCHSLDGSGKIGPTFLNLYGSTRLWKDNESGPADENYIRESILNPAAHVVAGYDNVMPTYQGRLSDREITVMITYLQSISENYTGDEVEQDTKVDEPAEADASDDKSQEVE